MTTHKICLDSEKFKNKPTKEIIGKISLRITKNKVEMDIRDLTKQLVQPNGKSWVPATFKGERQNENWHSQSLFALDFDSGITFEEVMQRLTEYGLSCTFAYTTFSNSPNLAKFRVVFQTQEAIVEPFFRDEIQFCLIALFPEVDKSCKDRARLFFGGQELIHEGYEYCLDIEKLIQAADFYSIKDISRSNMARSLQRRKKKFTSNEVGSKKHSLHSNYIGNGGNASNTDELRTTPKIVKGIDFHKLRQEIQILDEFMNPENKLVHPQLLGLATNLRYIEGGQKLFKECLNANSAYAQEKHKIMVYCKAQGYYPMQLERFSPYEEDWQYKTLLRAAKRKEVIRLEEYKAMTIEQARNRLRELIEQTIIPSNDTGIHVVKVPTAVGKTESCISLENVVIAFPHHALKTEVSHRMQVEHLVTPSTDDLPLSVKEKLYYYYSIGAIAEANRYLKKMAEEHEAVGTYLETCVSCYSSQETVLTTHQKALFIDWNQEIIIYDEDVIPTLLPISTVALSDLQKLADSIENTNDKEALQSLIDDVANGRIASPRSIDATVFKDFKAIEELVLDSESPYSDDILHFFDASHFAVDSQEENIIHYVRRYDLPENKKNIILSATADETIYRHLIGDRLKFYDVGNVETAGFIEQDTKYSFSRSSLSNPSHLAYAQEKVCDLPVITFKKFKSYFNNPVEDMHFGKTTGSDILKGQDIAVVGTPHANPITIALYSQALGISIQSSDFSKIGQKCIEHNGFRFWFNAYDNDNLRHLQFYFIESELRQAVGRARVNTEPARVRLLSSYPLPEAAINAEKISLL